MRCGLDVDYLLKDEAATIPGHTRAVYRDKSCSDPDCDVGYTLKAAAVPFQATPALSVARSLAAFALKAEPATILGHTHAVAQTSPAVTSNAMWATC